MTGHSQCLKQAQHDWVTARACLPALDQDWVTAGAGLQTLEALEHGGALALALIREQWEQWLLRGQRAAQLRRQTDTGFSILPAAAAQLTTNTVLLLL